MVNALLHLGLRTEARAFGEEALRRHPDWTPLWDEVLGLYEGDDLRAEMARRFDEAQPELPLAHLVAAKTLIAAGRAKAAVEEYRRAELLAPDDTQVVEGRTALELQEGRYAQAERYARRLLTLGADGEVQGYLWLANQKALRGRFGEAFQLWQRGDDVSARRVAWSQSAIVCAMSSRRNRLLTALELNDKAQTKRAADSLTGWVKLRFWNLNYQASGYMLGELARWRLGQVDRATLDQFIDQFAADTKHAVTPPLLGMVRVVEAELAHDAPLGVQAARELADVAGPAEQYASSLVLLESGDLHAAETRLLEVAQKPFADTEAAFKMMSPYHRIHALFRLGQIYERQRRPDAARQMYRRFVDAWADADRALPEVAEARRKIGE
jgi:tetratricopeptide (TPR) repeat protein